MSCKIHHDRLEVHLDILCLSLEVIKGKWHIERYIEIKVFPFNI